MGWNSWEHICMQGHSWIGRFVAASASLIKVGRCAALSWQKEAGYDYVVIDDCWQIGRDAARNIVADPERFPSGIKALADYVHRKGLKFGLYTDAGAMTCANRPGSLGHE